MSSEIASVGQKFGQKCNGACTHEIEPGRRPGAPPEPVEVPAPGGLRRAPRGDRARQAGGGPRSPVRVLVGASAPCGLGEGEAAPRRPARPRLAQGAGHDERHRRPTRAPRGTPVARGRSTAVPPLLRLGEGRGARARVPGAPRGAAVLAGAGLKRGGGDRGRAGRTTPRRRGDPKGSESLPASHSWNWTRRSGEGPPR